MKSSWFGGILGVALACSGRAGTPEQIVINTPLGAIVVSLDHQHAPKTVANFLYYVRSGAYQGGAFYRALTLQNQPDNEHKIEIIQGSAAIGGAYLRRPPVALERTSVTGLHHRAGTISMARETPDSATTDFFICVSDQPELDFNGQRNPDQQGFGAFGRVISGMDVVREIQRSASEGQKLQPPIPIVSIRLLDVGYTVR